MGHWGRWSTWSECSATCGQGVEHRTRTCTDPTPAAGGKGCVGDKDQQKKCEIQPCGLSKILLT